MQKNLPNESFETSPQQQPLGRHRRFETLRLSALTLRRAARTALCVLLLFIWCACTAGKEEVRLADEPPGGAEADANCDLDRIVESGELIIATLSGPESYYDYQGEPMGPQYALAEDFAREQGVSVRVEVARDSLALLRMLEQDEADVVCYLLPEALIAPNRLQAAGMRVDSLHTSWVVRRDRPQLAEALDLWYAEGPHTVALSPVFTKDAPRVRRKMRAPLISREKGLISTYDPLFRQAAETAGVDWRLIAAQCYQESGFDPNAVSWAGAKGLMQLMPGTAAYLGVSPSEIYAPAVNVEAAGRYLRELLQEFSDIRLRDERIKFALAAYNGGKGHIRDAMRLARKHRRNEQQWSEVKAYVLALEKPQFYRDPVVRHGYMIGSETAAYVDCIVERFRAYGGSMRGGAGLSAPVAPQPTSRKNRFTGGSREILRPDDPAFGNIAAQ